MTISSNFLLVRILLIVACVPGQGIPLWAGPVPAQSQPPAQSAQDLFTVSLVAMQEVVRSGSPVEMRVITTNIGDHEIFFWKENAYDQAGWAYRADVRDNEGHPPPDTELGRILKYHYDNSPNVGPGTAIHVSGGTLAITPGASETFTSDVSKLYDFSKPGRYAIQIERASEGGAKWVKSNTVTITVIAAATAAPSTIFAQRSQPPFSVRITASAGEISPGTPVTLKVVTRNLSDHSILLWTEKAEQDQAGSAYQIDIYDAKGNSPPLTEFGRMTNGRTDIPRGSNPELPPAGNGEQLVLKAGESWTDTIVVNKVYDLTESGEYSIQVQRFDPATSSMVKSNAVKVAVIP